MGSRRRMSIKKTMAKTYDPKIHTLQPDKTNGHIFHYIWGFCENCGHSIADSPVKCDPSIDTLIFKTQNRRVLAEIVGKVTDDFISSLKTK